MTSSDKAKELFVLNGLEGVEDPKCDGEPLITCCKYNYNGSGSQSEASILVT